MKLLVSILYNRDDAKVRIPSPQAVESYKVAINNQHPNLHDVYGVVDRVRLYLQQSGNEVIPHKFYIAWKRDHFVGNIFAFAPDGSILHVP